VALGARGVLLGRAYIYALAAAGQRGVSHLLELFAADMRVTMTLIGAKTVHEITRDSLALVEKELVDQGKDRRPIGGRVRLDLEAAISERRHVMSATDQTWQSHCVKPGCALSPIAEIPNPTLREPSRCAVSTDKLCAKTLSVSKLTPFLLFAYRSAN
jgi:hypothetical protein